MAVLWNRRGGVGNGADFADRLATTATQTKPCVTSRPPPSHRPSFAPNTASLALLSWIDLPQGLEHSFVFRQGPFVLRVNSEISLKMAYNARYTRGYDRDEVPINQHDNSDDEDDLANATLHDGIPMRSGISPFGDNTAYHGYHLEEDASYHEPEGYQESMNHHQQAYELRDPQGYESAVTYHSPSPNLKSGYFPEDPHEILTTPFSQAEEDPEAGFRERQQQLKRGHTRKVKLVNGDIFCTDYP